MIDGTGGRTKMLIKQWIKRKDGVRQRYNYADGILLSGIDVIQTTESPDITPPHKGDYVQLENDIVGIVADNNVKDKERSVDIMYNSKKRRTKVFSNDFKKKISKPDFDKKKNDRYKTQWNEGGSL